MTPSVHTPEPWRVYLVGQSGSLDKLVALRSRAWQVEQESDRYYLTSPDFESLTDKIDVWNVAGGLLATIGAAAEMEIGYCDPITCGLVSRGAPQLSKNERTVPVSVTLAYPPVTPLADCSASIWEVMEALRHDDNVREAAHHLRRTDAVWTMVARCAYEIIRDDVASETGADLEGALGPPPGVGWVAEDEFSRFWTALHNRRASGFAALHARGGSRKRSDHPNPMRRAEADVFVRRLFARWACWKYDSYDCHDGIVNVNS